MKGVPLRIEVGMRDVEANMLTIVRRDTSEKNVVDFQQGINSFQKTLDDIQDNLYNKALQFQNDNTLEVANYNEFKDSIKNGAFVVGYWDGNPESEQKIKNDTNATIRCILENDNLDNKTCIYSGKPAHHKVIFAKAY